jgi:hypothetical protein
MRLAKYNEGLAMAEMDANWFSSDEPVDDVAIHDTATVDVVNVGDTVESKSAPVDKVIHDQPLRPARGDDVRIRDRGADIPPEDGVGSGTGDTSVPPQP